MTSRSRRWPAVFAAAAAVFLLVAGLQWWTGAYQAEFGGHPDEAAHYITGLMVRDYLASGLPGNPMPFAQRYYEHYPKVALGNWPPVFYLIQAAWTLVLPPTRLSMVLLMALMATATALLTMWLVWRDHGPAAGAFAGFTFLTFPIVPQYGGMVMTEIPVALLALLATLCFGRYLRTERSRDSVLLGLFASAAILTKGSGMVLALVAPLALAMSGRWPLLKRASLWYPVIVVAVLAGPWTYAFREQARAGWVEPGLSMSYIASAAKELPGSLLNQGRVIAVFALVGLVAVIAGLKRRTLPTEWAAMAALLPATLLFHVIVPASTDERHLVPGMPGWAALAAAGAVAMHDRLAARRRRAGWIPYAIGVAAVLLTALPPLPNRGRGFAPAVNAFVRSPENADAVFLVSSDAAGEGMFIALVAMGEARPGHTILRASKLLSQQHWHGGSYTLHVQQQSDLLKTLRQANVKYVLVDDSLSSQHLAPHHELVRTTVASSPEFTLRARYPVTRGYPYLSETFHYPDALSVYELRPAAAVRAGR